MLYDQKQWIKDIDLATAIVPELVRLENCNVLITGASGLICSAIVDIFFRYNDTHEKKIKIFAAGRSKKRMTERFGAMTEREDFTYVPYDSLQYGNPLPDKIDYIIHGAGIANPPLFVKNPVETMLGNILGSKSLLDYAGNNQTKRFLYISSSEVYGEKESDEPFKENDSGFVDLLDPRNSYAMGKRAAETLCISYASEYGVDIVIARPGHIYGPTAAKTDTRVSSIWPYMAARGEDIVMKSDGAQIRSYCYCLDCASAILKILLEGDSNRAYNISNSDSIISIRELAGLIAKSAKVNLYFEMPSEVEKQGFNPMSNSSLSSAALEKIGWKGCFNAETGLVHTISMLKEIL